MQTETSIANSVVPGLKLESEFRPYSASEIPDRVVDWQIRWKIRLILDERTIIETDYFEGIGNIKGWKQSLLRPMSVYDYDQITRVLTGGESNDYAVVPPTLDDCVYALTVDSDVIDYESFEDWAKCMGMDTDSRQAEKTYQACLKTALQLRSKLGDDVLKKLREAFVDY